MSAGIVCMFLFCRWKRKELCKLRKQKLEQQFRDWIEGVSHHLETGCSVENAFVRAGKELELLYGGESDILREARSMEHLLANNVPLEKVLSDFAERSQVSDICHFADVFAIGKRSGGNLKELIGDSCEIIAMRTDTEREIRTLLHGKIMEQKVMCLIPFGIIFYISISSPGYFAPLYHNPAGICVMTLCLTVYLFSVWLSLWIIHIEV